MSAVQSPRSAEMTGVLVSGCWGSFGSSWATRQVAKNAAHTNAYVSRDMSSIVAATTSIHLLVKRTRSWERLPIWRGAPRGVECENKGFRRFFPVKMRFQSSYTYL